jgi:hypothetical protein
MSHQQERACGCERRVSQQHPPNQHFNPAYRQRMVIMILREVALLMSFCIFTNATLVYRCGAADSASLVQPEEVTKARAFFAKRLARRKCDPPTTTFPRWAGFPVQNCDYTDVGITTKAFMLNPSADQLARWTVTACHDAQATAIDKCIAWMGRVILDASSGVFPVAGFIVEPAGSAGGQGNGALCLLFRDGVTIATADWDSRPPTGGKCGSDDENDKPVLRAKRFARVASTTRQEYRDAGGAEPVGTDKDHDVRWLDVVRKLYQQAWTSERNELISAKAKAEKARGKFK